MSRYFKKIKVNSANKLILFYIILILTFGSELKAQTDKFTQFSNEFQISRAISDKWASELWIGSAFSNTPTENRILKTNIQRYIVTWMHYHYTPRWRFSSSLAYYYNKDVPDIGQYKSPEYRLTLQGLYYFHKIGYTLSTRMRGEFRYLMNEEGDFEDNYRYRQMVKFLKPLNSKFLRQGVFYLLADDEIWLKPNAKSTGLTFFDRNRFEIGGGYIITDDLQVELSYVNEFLPRDDVNQLYNCVSLTISFNNLISNFKKRFIPQSSEGVQPD